MGAVDTFRERPRMGKLHDAARKGNLEEVKKLVKEDPSLLNDEKKLKDYAGWTPLHSASSNGHLSVVEWLVDKNPSLLNDEMKLKNKDGDTPLHIASNRGHLAVVKWLVEKKPSLLNDEKLLKTNDGWTPLHVASIQGHLSVVEWLVEKNPSLLNDEKLLKNNGGGETPLHWASMFDHLSVVQWLVEKNPFLLNDEKLLKNNDGWTPLHYASREGDLSVVQWLVEKNPSLVPMKNNEGKTAADWTSNKKIKAVLSSAPKTTSSSPVPPPPQPSTSSSSSSSSSTRRKSSSGSKGKKRRSTPKVQPSSSSSPPSLSQPPPPISPPPPKKNITLTSPVKITGELGSGSYGLVYLGKYAGLDVAVKVSQPGRSHDDLFEEAAIQASVSHPCIVSVYGTTTVTLGVSKPAAVFEHMGGGSLEDHLKKSHPKGVKDESLLMKWSSQIAVGVQHLHSVGLLHRDLATRNVLLSKDLSQAKISDFGLSKKLDEGRRYATGTAVKSYLSAPEVISGSEYGRASDVFCFGGILFELGTGYHPLGHPSVQGKNYPSNGEKLVLPEIDRSAMPRWICGLIEDCWRDDPKSRPSMDEIVGRLG